MQPELVPAGGLTPDITWLLSSVAINSLTHLLAWPLLNPHVSSYLLQRLQIPTSKERPAGTNPHRAPTTLELSPERIAPVLLKK